jgi:hypothetical protein
LNKTVFVADNARCFGIAAAAISKFADKRSLPDFEIVSAGVKVVVPAEFSQDGGLRAKPEKINKHLNYPESMKHEWNLGSGCEKSVKNPE